MLLSRDEYTIEITKVYDNLTKSQFETLMENVSNRMVELKEENKVKLIKSELGDVKIEFTNTFDELAWNVATTVAKSKKLSFKQFRVLSQFSKTHWLEKYEEIKFKDFS